MVRTDLHGFFVESVESVGGCGEGVGCNRLH